MNDQDNTGAIVSWEEDQPRSLAYDDVYYSVDDGLEESRYVFLQGNDLQQRWAKLKPNTSFTIAETGFGTGLNFLAAWQLWEQMADVIPESCVLHFISVEKYPLRGEQLSRAHKPWPELESLSQTLTNAYPPLPWFGLQTLDFSHSKTGRAGVQLTLIFEDVKTAFSHISIRPDLGAHARQQGAQFGETPTKVDAWFLDGFAPSKNPDMWCESLFRSICEMSNTYTSVATFTAAGMVKRALNDAGFTCIKRKGFGRKREMLTGIVENDLNSPSGRVGVENEQTHHKSRALARSTTRVPTWPYKSSAQAVNTNKEAHNPEVLIIGAGLAGCHTAHALAQRGFKVRIIDKGEIASGASSNIQGAVYTRLSDSNEPLSYFNRTAQIFADTFYENTGLYTHSGSQSGVLHLAGDVNAEKRLNRFAFPFGTNTRFQYVSSAEVSNIAGITLTQPALFSARSGWLSPKDVCKHLIKHKNIALTEGLSVSAIKYDEGRWHIHGQGQDISAQICIVANAAMAKNFEQLSTMPLQSIRGQVNHIESNGRLSQLKTVVCGEGYLTPATQIQGTGVHCIGATFNLKSMDKQIDDKDTDRNLHTLLELSPEIESKHLKPYNAMPAKVGFRSTTPDYLPIIGPVPNIAGMREKFERLSKKANADVDACGEYYPGLYCCVGFGSRGLAYTPLAANLLASLISGAFLPVSQHLYQHLHPGRFVIRSLVKNKPLSD